MFSLRCYVALLRTWRRRRFHGINAMILMPQIFDVTANENARYKRNELELLLNYLYIHVHVYHYENILLKSGSFPKVELFNNMGQIKQIEKKKL